MGLPKIRSTTRPRGATPLDRPTTGPVFGSPRAQLVGGGLLLGAFLLLLGVSGDETAVSISADVAGTPSTNTALASSELGADALSSRQALDQSTAESSSVPTEPPWREEVVRNGDNLSLIFARAGNKL